MRRSPFTNVIANGTDNWGRPTRPLSLPALTTETLLLQVPQFRLPRSLFGGRFPKNATVRFWREAQHTSIEWGGAIRNYFRFSRLVLDIPYDCVRITCACTALSYSAPRCIPTEVAGNKSAVIAKNQTGGGVKRSFGLSNQSCGFV